MAKFKKGDRVRFIIEDGYLGIEYNKGSEAVVENHILNLVTLTDYGVVFASRLELITDNQPNTPKVGERYRVVKDNQHFDVGDTVQCVTVEKTSICAFLFEEVNSDYRQWLTGCSLTTEYLELVEEELPVNRHVDVPKEYFDTLDTVVKPIGAPYRLHDLELWQKMYEEWVEPTINKTKQTTMQKLTSALKRVLSADKQTLYKARMIGSDLELTEDGQTHYTDALFNNEGDHKKAVAEMVAMAQTELDEAKA